jgi:hypothetical protein
MPLDIDNVQNVMLEISSRMSLHRKRWENHGKIRSRKFRNIARASLRFSGINFQNQKISFNGKHADDGN